MIPPPLSQPTQTSRNRESFQCIDCHSDRRACAVVRFIGLYPNYCPLMAPSFFTCFVQSFASLLLAPSGDDFHHQGGRGCRWSLKKKNQGGRGCRWSLRCFISEGSPFDPPPPFHFQFSPPLPNPLLRGCLWEVSWSLQDEGVWGCPRGGEGGGLLGGVSGGV